MTNSLIPREMQRLMDRGALIKEARRKKNRAKRERKRAKKK